MGESVQLQNRTEFLVSINHGRLRCEQPNRLLASLVANGFRFLRPMAKDDLSDEELELSSRYRNSHE